MGEDGRAVTLHVFVEPDAGASLGHDRASVALPRGDSASFQGIAEAECLLVNAIRYDAKHNHDQGQHEDDQFSRLGAYAGRSILLTSAVSFEPKIVMRFLPVVAGPRFLADRGSGDGVSRRNAGFPPALVASTQEYL
jgi:hypothetical protein